MITLNTEIRKNLCEKNIYLFNVESNRNHITGKVMVYKFSIITEKTNIKPGIFKDMK